MKNKILTFELVKDSDAIEIHVNREGLSSLIEVLQRFSDHKNSDHEHLMTPSWGGKELTENLQGQENKLINHVKIFLWNSK